MTEEDIISEDGLIKGLIDAKGRRVEVFAFGMAYVGNLNSVDIDHGFITVTDGEDTAMLEFERIEYFNVLEV